MPSPAVQVELPTDADVRCPVCAAPAAPYCRVRSAAYLRCTGCRGIFLHPMPSPGAMEVYADEEYRSGVYEQYTRARDLKLTTFRRRMTILGRYVSSGRLLDLGCACGFMLEAALEAGFDPVGVEFSQAAIAAARPEIRGRIHHGDVDAAPPGPFDVVTAFDIVEHTHDPAATLSRWTGLLRPGGVLMLTTPDTESFLRPLMGRRWPHLQPEQHTFLFSRRHLPAALLAAGLIPVLVEPAVKVMSAGYLLGQLDVAVPALARFGAMLDRALPGPMRQPIPFRIGECLAVARRTT